MVMPDAGYGLWFNGTNTIVTAQDNACFGWITNEMSVAGWFKTLQSGSAACLMMRDQTFYLSKTAADKISFTYFKGGAWQTAVVSNGAIPYNKWTHVAATVSNGAVNIYINGTLDQTHIGGATTINNGATIMTLGKTAVTAYANDIYNGLMDDICVFPMALTVPEVEFLAAKNSPATVNYTVTVSSSPAGVGLTVRRAFGAGGRRTTHRAFRHGSVAWMSAGLRRRSSAASATASRDGW